MIPESLAESLYFSKNSSAPEKATWFSPPRIHQPKPKPEKMPENIAPEDLSKWLIAEVLGEPEKLNSFMQARLTRDLTYGCSTATTGGMYFNESSANFDGRNTRVPFNFEMAYNHFVNLCQRRNSWETKRAEVFKLT